MSTPFQKDSSSLYSYADYLTWSGEERWELIEGRASMMTPAPSRRHQEILVELTRQISEILIDKPCKVYIAPFDVRLTEQGESDEEVKTVVQPDLLIVCDKAKLDEKGCLGAPDFIIEIVSPSTASLDYIKKLSLYEKYQVKEYWILQPVDQVVMVYELNEENIYGRPRFYTKDDQAKIGILEDGWIDLRFLSQI